MCQNVTLNSKIVSLTPSPLPNSQHMRLTITTLTPWRLLELIAHLSFLYNLSLASVFASCCSYFLTLAFLPTPRYSSPSFSSRLRRIFSFISLSLLWLSMSHFNLIRLGLRGGQILVELGRAARHVPLQQNRDVL